MRRRPFPRDRWSPGNLGPLAWWSADPSFVTLSGSGVTRVRNRIDGRSGVLSQATSTRYPQWESSVRAGRPAFRFYSTAESADRFDEETSLQSSGRATVIDALAGTNKPFSVLATVTAINPIFDQTIWIWGSNATSAQIDLTILSSGKLQLTRQDDAGTFANLTGNLELGTSLHRIGATFDGASLTIFQDAQVDNAIASAGGQGVITPNRFRVGDNFTGGESDFGSDLYLTDLVVLQRAVTLPEWLHYYGWSTKVWGRIASPTYNASGAGVDTADGTGAAMAVPYPSANPGDLYVLQVGSRNEVNPPSTPSGWTLQYGPESNGATTIRTYFRNTRSAGSGSEPATLSYTTGSGGNMWCAMMHSFSGVTKGSTGSGFFESGVSTAANGPGNLTAPSLSALGDGRLAVAFVAFNEDQDIAAFSGAGGGTWVRQAQYRTQTGANFTLQMQTAAMPIAGALTGGTTNLATSDRAICEGAMVIGE